MHEIKNNLIDKEWQKNYFVTYNYIKICFNNLLAFLAYLLRLINQIL